MIKKLVLFTFLMGACNLPVFGQNNPVENVIWSYTHEIFHDFFELTWDQTAEPHSELIGYNIYRNNELFRFQTDVGLYNIYSPVYGFISNCSTEFLDYDGGNGFDIHVTAVYNPGPTESDYLQTAHCLGLVLKNTDFKQQKAILFPNPTNGILNIGNENLEKILMYDVSGKMVGEFAPEVQINVSNLSKGLYIIKLFSDKGVILEKVVIQ